MPWYADGLIIFLWCILQTRTKAALQEHSSTPDPVDDAAVEVVSRSIETIDENCPPKFWTVCALGISLWSTFIQFETAVW